jgi:hypothetical protein
MSRDWVRDGIVEGWDIVARIGNYLCQGRTSLGRSSYRRSCGPEVLVGPQEGDWTVRAIGGSSGKRGGRCIRRNPTRHPNRRRIFFKV